MAADSPAPKEVSAISLGACTRARPSLTHNFTVNKITVDNSFLL